MLVHINHATRYVLATPSASLGAHSVTDAPYRSIILRYGPPRDLVLYDWPKQGDHKLSPIFKGPFVIVRPVGAVCYEIKFRVLQNKFIKIVHVQHLCPYFKRDADVMQNNTSDEENYSSAENQDPAEDHQEVSVTTEPPSSQNHLRRNRRPPKRFEQYVS
ncbi:uncharacterized protein TNCV_12731 [Trichonephila clavipes]|nr:uncharacterized protein TNCV_12731 [Trichonephila clavipes]